MSAIPYGYERFVISTGRSAAPNSLGEIQDWLRIDTDDEDVLISAISMSCQNILEDLTNSTLMQQTMTAYFDGFPPNGTPISLPRPPLVSITHIKYVDEDGATQTWSGSFYTVSNLGTMPATILPIESEDYPSTGDTPTLQKYNKMEIEYEAGYELKSSIPDGFVLGHKMFVGHFYENREVSSTVKMHELPLGLQMIAAANQVPQVN